VNLVRNRDPDSFCYVPNKLSAALEQQIKEGKTAIGKASEKVAAVKKKTVNHEKGGGKGK